MKIEKNIPLHDKNWFGTGGLAEYFCQPEMDDDWVQALAFAREHNLEITALGDGANVLINDDGVKGLVIRPNSKKIFSDSATSMVTAGAGVKLPVLIDYCLDNGLGGLEEFSGIPGTVGGCVYINIHYFEFLLSKFLVSARVINKNTAQVMTVDNAWFSFGYNESTLQQGIFLLLEASFKLKPIDVVQAAYAKGRRDEMIRYRSKRYPAAKTCGSFFRNFHEHEIPFLINGKKVPFVAYYLDKIGVKGSLRVGNAAVSHHHANMLVTQQDATSADIINLAKKMQQMVFDQFGIRPFSECQFLGFKNNPLL